MKVIEHINSNEDDLKVLYEESRNGSVFRLQLNNDGTPSKMLLSWKKIRQEMMQIIYDTPDLEHLIEEFGLQSQWHQFKLKKRRIYVHAIWNEEDESGYSKIVLSRSSGTPKRANQSIMVEPGKSLLITWAGYKEAWFKVFNKKPNMDLREYPSYRLLKEYKYSVSSFDELHMKLHATEQKRQSLKEQPEDIRWWAVLNFEYESPEASAREALGGLSARFDKTEDQTTRMSIRIRAQKLFESIQPLLFKKAVTTDEVDIIWESWIKLGLRKFGIDVSIVNHLAVDAIRALLRKAALEH